MRAIWLSLISWSASTFVCMCNQVCTSFCMRKSIVYHAHNVINVIVCHPVWQKKLKFATIGFIITVGKKCFFSLKNLCVHQFWKKRRNTVCSPPPTILIKCLKTRFVFLSKYPEDQEFQGTWHPETSLFHANEPALTQSIDRWAKDEYEFHYSDD